MPETQATQGLGVLLTIDAVLVGELNNIGDLVRKQAFLDVSHHSSPDNYREFLVNKLKDGGSLPIAGNYVATDAGQAAVQAALEAGTKNAYVITFPDGTTCTFNGYVEEYAVKSPMDKQMEYSGSIKITGKPVMGYSSSAGLTTPFFVVSESAVVAPAKSGSVYEYVANVLTAISSVTVTPTATAGVIEVNGNVVATGVASSAITLGAAGSITNVSIVVTETGKAPKTYTIHVVRAAA